MHKKKGLNKHQKAVYKVGERHTSREEIAEMLVLSHSEEVEDRLCAAEHLCPCHVRTRIPAVWEALFRLMEDVDKRVRQQAWHTIEDGGKPNTSEAIVIRGWTCMLFCDYLDQGVSGAKRSTVLPSGSRTTA